MEETQLSIQDEPPFLKQIYQDLVECLTEPRKFFEVRYPKLSLSYILAFGVLINWVAAFLDWLTRIVHHETLLDGLLKLREKLQTLPVWKNLPSDIWAQNSDSASATMPAWAAEMFGLALSPFQSLFMFIVRGLVLWIGIYLLYPRTEEPRDPPQLKHALQISALCSAPQLVGSILGFLPLSLGSFVAAIYGLALMLIALTVRFRVSGLRAFGMVFIPGIVVTALISCFTLIVGVIIFGSLAALFGASH